jgi:hypothetical protein
MRLCQSLIPGHFDPRLQLEAECRDLRPRSGRPLLGVVDIHAKIRQTIAAIDGLHGRWPLS